MNDTKLQIITAKIKDLPVGATRRLIAIAGPPASGKSTISEHIADAIPKACVVPMDGFHLENCVLESRGLLSRKGAPQTFDVEGFVALVKALKTRADMAFPIFDRAKDTSIENGGIVPKTCDTVIFEGNYLLLNAPQWQDLRTLWDLSIYLDVPEDILRERLINRWLEHGLGADQAIKRAEHNDLPNAKLVAQSARNADIVV